MQQYDDVNPLRDRIVVFLLSEAYPFCCQGPVATAYDQKVIVAIVDYLLDKRPLFFVSRWKKLHPGWYAVQLH